MDDIVRFIDGYVKEGYRVLDVGCGDGDIMKELERLNPQAISRGVDPFPGYIKCDNLLAEEIDQLGEVFDLIYLVRTFHHIRDLKGFFSSVKKVLKDRGNLLIVDWKRGVDTGVDERYYDLEEVEAMLEGEGLKVERSFETEEMLWVVAEKV